MAFPLVTKLYKSTEIDSLYEVNLTVWLPEVWILVLRKWAWQRLNTGNLRVSLLDPLPLNPLKYWGPSIIVIYSYKTHMTIRI